MQKKTTVSSKLSLIVKFALGIGLLVLVLYWADPAKVYHRIMNADGKHLAAAFMLCWGSYLMGIKRWQILSRSLGIEASFNRFVALYFLGLFCNNFLPTGIGGDFVKAHFLGKSRQTHTSYLSVMLDRYVGLLVLLVVASLMAFTLPPDDFHNKLAVITWVTFFAMLVGGIVGLKFSERFAVILERFEKKRLADQVRELSSLIIGFFRDYRVVSGTFLLSIGAQAFCILAVHQLSLAVGARGAVSSFFIIVPLVLIISVLPISFGGLGTREFAFVYMLSRIFIQGGMEKDTAEGAAAGVAFLWLIVNLLSSLPGAPSYPLLSKKIEADLKASTDSVQ